MVTSCYCQVKKQIDANLLKENATHSSPPLKELFCKSADFHIHKF